MIVIADSGGTGTDWCFYDNGSVRSVHTPGLNPHHGLPTADELRQQLLAGRGSSHSVARYAANAMLWKDMPAPLRLPPDGGSAGASKPTAEHFSLFFYGAGCTSEQIPRMQGLLSEAFDCPIEQVHVASDIVGAARAVCGDKPGLVAILGTGANACYWDGKQAVPGPRSLGYILGDEGSGAYIGRLLLRAILRGNDATLTAAFAQETGLTYADILARVYRQPQANAFLASLAPFAASHRQHPLVQEALGKAFTDFAEQLLLPLVAEHGCRSIGLVGSIAEHFRPELAESLARHGIAINHIVAKPIEALAAYHTREASCK